MVQFARARGLTVIGTSSERRHDYLVHIERTFPLRDGALAHALSQDGHVRGKVVITVP